MKKKFFVSPLVAFLILLLAGVGVLAYGGSVPSVLGHSAEEVRLVIVTRTSNCALPVSLPNNQCIATCNAGEKVVGGSCISDSGYAYEVIGYSTSLSSGLSGWECWDPNLADPSGPLKLRAQVNCLVAGT